MPLKLPHFGARVFAVLAGLMALLALQFTASMRSEADEAPVIAAAADLKFALHDVAEAFTSDTGLTVRLVFGSSGTFYSQIQEGAPFQMYLSADEQFVHDLHAKGFAADDGTLYAVGRIVIMVPHGSKLKADPDFADLKAALADGRLRRFAIANPEHAPYGRRAEEALKQAGLWEQIKDRLVLGENVSQAAQFAMTGSAEGGIIAYSLALSPQVAKLGSFALIPAAWHEPLRQRMVLLKSAGDTARAFYNYVQQPAARVIFRKYGFVLPGETS